MGKVSSDNQVQNDTVSITVTRQQAKDLIVALSQALQSGGGKNKNTALADNKTGKQPGKNA